MVQGNARGLPLLHSAVLVCGAVQCMTGCSPQGQRGHSWASLGSSVFADRLSGGGASQRLVSVPTARKVRLPLYISLSKPRVPRKKTRQDIEQFASFPFKVQALTLKRCWGNILL